MRWIVSWIPTGNLRALWEALGSVWEVGRPTLSYRWVAWWSSSKVGQFVKRSNRTISITTKSKVTWLRRGPLVCPRRSWWRPKRSSDTCREGRCRWFRSARRPRAACRPWRPVLINKSHTIESRNHHGNHHRNQSLMRAGVYRWGWDRRCRWPFGIDPCDRPNWCPARWWCRPVPSRDDPDPLWRAPRLRCCPIAS